MALVMQRKASVGRFDIHFVVWICVDCVDLCRFVICVDLFLLVNVSSTYLQEICG